MYADPLLKADKGSVTVKKYGSAQSTRTPPQGGQGGGTAAVKNYSSALKYADPSSRRTEVVLAAVEKDSKSLRFVDNPSIPSCDEALYSLPSSSSD